MGMTWRSTMPLLSTLAALVIIVHSQEEMERGYRRELRPRVVDTASYEQPWKAIDMEPLVQHSTRAEVWNESPEETPARRRPVRKRKRRPLPYPGIEPQERHQESIQGTYHDIDYHDSQQTMETTRKRRKRPDFSHHLQEEPNNHDESPLRRRGLRRKRPFDYDIQTSELISPAPEDESDKSVNYFIKHDQFDYDDTEVLPSRHETLASHSKNTDMLAYNRTFGVEEQRNVFRLSNVRLPTAEPESSSAAADNQREKIIQEMRHPMEPSKNDNKDIMVMLNNAKVKKLKLGIIINGTEHSYLQLPIPEEEAYAVYDYSLVTTQMFNVATNSSHNDEDINYFSLSAEDLDFDNRSTTLTSKLNCTTNAGWSHVMPQNSINAADVTTDNIENSKILLDHVTSDIPDILEYIDFPFIATSGGIQKSKEKSNSAISLSHGIIKPKYFSGQSSSEKVEVVSINSFSSGHAEFFSQDNGTEPHYINLPLLSHNLVAIYDIPTESTEKPVTEYVSQKYNKVHDYILLSTPVSKDVAIDGYSKTDTEIAKGTFKMGCGNTENKYFSLPTPVKVIINTPPSKDNTEQYRTTSPSPAVEVITDRGPSKHTEKPNIVFDLGNSDNVYTYFPKPPIPKVYTDSQNIRNITENSNSEVNLGNGENEHNYLPLPTDKTKKSNLGINLSTTENALVSTSQKNLHRQSYTLTEHNDFRKVMNTSNGVTHSGKGRVKYSKGRSDSDMLCPIKWINTNKWIAKIKLQIPRLTPAEINEFDALQAEYEENGVIEPFMLKEILKRSNGSSLSEILQRHNLSLADLLQGKNEAISALNAEASAEPQLQLNDASPENTPQLNEAESKYPTRQQSLPEQKPVGIESNSGEGIIESTTENVETVTDTTDVIQTEHPEIKPRMSAKRRFPTGIRRKLRMRPMLNSTLKAQLSRDLIALSARKYSRNNRNATKAREWKDIVPLMVDRSNTTDETSKDDATEPSPTTTEGPVDTTVASLEISNSSYPVSNTAETGSVKENEIENTVLTTTETTTIIIEVLPSELTERPKVTPIVRPTANNSTLRRQAFNNRLKRKRQKQKSSTKENPNDDLMKNFLGMANLVSASHFIERTQKPYATIKQDNTEFATELEDFLTTQPPRTVDEDGVKSTEVGTTRFASSTIRSVSQTSTTEQSAKFEIEEILNDTMTSERLAKILLERNMTLSELVNHRERGSSHVHLADIFHNASKEPNPPEPFLTKSSIEPISKETYPLRAILEANTHETTTRPTSSQVDQRNQHIPVVMDFGNNVNENGESMGIISLFNKFTDRDLSVDKTELRQDSDGTPYVSSVISVNATNTNDTSRESRVLANSEDWKVLLSFMKEHNISTFEEDLQTLNKEDTETESFDEDLEGDGLMVLEDVQHLQNIDSNIAYGLDENLQVNMYERRENLSDTSGNLSNMSSNTKSVAIATASILGLAAILFLLTYIAFKWKQERDKVINKLRKKESFCAGPIPSPVFEKRKGHKHNCSSRSISPMISNTNIYMSTLDSRNGNESPDYTWNSLRKPFQ